MESMLLKQTENKKQKFQLIGLHNLKGTKEIVSKQISIALKRFPLTSKKRLNSLETNS